MEPADRRLAAILSGDVAGYSRLMGVDEDATIAALSAARAIIEQTLPTHGGRLVDFTGDNFLAEFSTATGALACAVEVQRRLAEGNATAPADRKMQFRIGIHLGEVRAEEGHIYGDGVNTASRLEGLAEPGGICISDLVYKQVRNRLDLSYEDLGERSVKNIAEPVRIYRVKNDGRDDTGRPTATRRRMAVGVVALLLVAAVAAGAWWLLGKRPVAVVARTGAEASRSADAKNAQPIHPDFGERPAIAVLPFDNLSGDPEQEYFADGISEDLITRLSSWGSFPVIARNSSFVYKGRAVDLKKVSADLGVRYVVEGSVRKSADRVRISAQVIDAETGHHVWAKTYDRQLEDIFAVQDDVTTAIAAAMYPELLQSESVRALHETSPDLNAWDLALRGRWHLWSGDPAENAKAKALFEKAIEADPYFADAYSLLAIALYDDVTFQWTDDPDRSLEEMLRNARKGVELAPNRPIVYGALGLSLTLTGKREEVLEVARRIVDLDPSNVYGYWLLGLAFAGSPDTAQQGVEVTEKALRLSPRDRLRWAFYDNLGIAYRAMGDYERSVEASRRVLQLYPSYAWEYFALASDYAHLGRLDEAREALQEGLRRQPGLSVELMRQSLSFVDPEVVDRFLEGLRKAGWEG